MSTKTDSARNTRNIGTRRSRAPTSLPDMNRKRSSAEQLNTRQWNDELHQNPHLMVDDFLHHSEAMGGRGLENGDVRNSSTAEGEVGRFRIMTAKGVENQKKVHNDNRVRAMRRVSRTIRSIDKLLNDYSNVENVKGSLLEVDHLFSDVMESHGKYHALIDDYEERQESSKWMNDNDAVVFGFKSFANKWVSDFNKKQNESNDLRNSNRNFVTTQMHQNNNENNNITSKTFNKEHSRLLPGIPNVDAPEFVQTDSRHHVYPPPEHNTPLPHTQHASATYQHTPHHTPRHPNDFELTRSRASSSISSVSQQSGRSIRSTSTKSSRVFQRSRIRSNSDPVEQRIHSSHRAHSSRSHRAGSKHNSSVSSKVSLYVEQKAKVAALKAEAKFMKESREVKGTEEWELGKEIAKAEAIADVYAHEEGRSTTPIHHNMVENGIGTGSRHVEESIVKLLQLQTAPTVDIDEYDGNPLEFNYFLATFKEVVEQKVEDPRGRLTRLIKYTKGEAKELIKNCIQEDPSSGYIHAMSLLRTQYGNPHIIARAYIKELRKWEPLKVGDSKAFRKFYGFLVKCKTCMGNGQYLTELNFPDILQVLQSKLPYSMQDKWNRRAVKLRTSDGREADFDDFLEIVETETMVANDPMYSREAMNYINNNNDTNTKGNNNINKHNLNKNLQNKQVSNFSVGVEQETNLNEKDEHQINTMNTQKEVASPHNEILKQVSCVYCQQNHDIDDCSEFKILDMKNKKAFIFRKRLCFSCFKAVSPAHTSKTCRNKRKCKVCNALHPTVLHVDESTKEGDSEVPLLNAATGCDVKSHNKGEEINQVVSLCIVPVKVRHNLNPDNVITVYAMLDNCSDGTFVTEEIAGALSNPKTTMNDDVAQKLAASIKPTNISIKTLNGMSVKP